MSTATDAAPAAESPSDAAPQGEVSAEGQSAAEKPEPDWKAEARKHEARSKEWAAKARANEEAARRLAEIEESQKTEAQKAAERLAEAEKRAAELEARANRASVANTAGVPEALLAGPASSSPEDLEAFAQQLIEFRGAKTPVGVHLPNQDKAPKSQKSELSESVRRLFGGGQ